MTNRYRVASANVAREKKFYDEAETVYNDIETFKDRLRARNEEFDMLLEYYEKHRGVLDVYNRPVCGPRAYRPNLGTKDQSWYYLDGAGNKIWVRNVELDTTDPRCGAFDSAAARQADQGRLVVVKIPKTKTNYNVLRDYCEKIGELDASYRLPRSERRHNRTNGDALTHTVFPLPQDALGDNNKQEEMGTTHGDGRVSVEEYIRTQKTLGSQLDQMRPTNRPEYVWRPPATIEEAEARLMELKREAAEIEHHRLREQQHSSS